MATQGGDTGGAVYLRVGLDASGVADGVSEIKQELNTLPAAAAQAAQGTNKSLATLGVPADATANIERFKDAFGGIARATKEELGESARFTNSYVSQLKRTASDVDAVTQSMVTRAKTLQSADPRLQNETVNQAIAGLQKLASQNEVVTAAVKQQAAAQQVANKVMQEAAAQAANFERSVQSARLELLAFGKTPVQKAQIKAELLGIDKNAATKTLLADLQAAQAAAEAAGLGVGKSLTPALQGAALQGRALNAALRQVPAQFTDIVVSLQGGQAPLTVLLQQGGQLKDIFGGVGEATRALSGYVVGLINPFTVVAAAAAAVGFGFFAGRKESEEFNKALILTGNQTGVTASSLALMATNISAVSGTTGAAAEALTAFAAAGAVGAAGIQKATEAALALEKFGGQAVAETVKQFKSLGDDPLKASIKLNESTNFLTASVYQQIKALEEQGRTIEAAKVAQDAFTESSLSKAGELEKNLGTLERGWLAVKSAISGAGDALKNIGRIDPISGQVAAAQAEVDRLQRPGATVQRGLNLTSPVRPSDIAEAQAQLDLLNRRALKEQEISTSKAAQKLETDSLISADKILDGLASKKVKMDKELAETRTTLVRAGKDEVVIQEALTAVRKKYAESASKPKEEGLSEAQRAVAQYVAELQKRIDKEENLSEVQKANNLLASLGNFGQIKQVKELVVGLAEKKDSLDAEAAATKAAVKAYNEYQSAQEKILAGYQQSADAAEKSVQKYADEEAALSLSATKNISLAEAIAEVELARLRETKAKELAKGADGATLLALQKEIEAREKIGGFIGRKDARDAEKKAAQEAAAEWKRGWEETDRLARDVFTTWATDGSNAAKKIGDTLKKALLSAIYEATLKPIVMQVYGSIAGGGGASTALQAASGGGGNAISGLGSLFSAGGAVANGISSIGGALMNGPFSSLVGDLGASLVSNSAAIASAVPYVGAALFAVKALTDYKVEARGSGLTATIGGASGLPSGSVGMFREFSQTSSGILSGGNTINRDWSVADQGVANYIAANVKNITASNKAYAAALGLTSGSIDTFTKSIEVNIDGLDAAGQQAAINAQLKTFEIEQAASAFGTSVAAFAKEGETSAQTLQRLGTDLTSANAMFKTLGYALFDVSVTGAAAASKLIAAFGSVSEAASQIGSFQQNYFSQAERDSSTLANAQATLQAAGLTFSIEQLVAATAGDIKAAVAELASNAGSSDTAAAQYAAAVRAANSIASIKTATTNTPSSSTQAGGGFTPYSPEWFANGGAGGSSGSDALLPSSSGGASAADTNMEAARSLQEQLDQLTLSAMELQKRQLAAQRELLNESNKLLFDQVQAAQLAKTNREYQDRIDVLTGKTTDRALSLQRELAAATDASTQSLINLVYSLEDMKTVSEQAISAAKDAYSNAQSGTDKAYAALERSVSAQKAVAQEAIANAKAVIDSVGNAVKGLFSQVDSVVQSEAAKGLSFIDNALSAAQTTGYLPDPKDLSKAIGQATGGIDKTQFASQADADFARLVLAGKLNALGDLAEPQLTAAEEQVKQLEAVLETARTQIDALRGIDNSVKSVEEAIKLLAAAMSAERAAKAGSLIPKGGTVPLNTNLGNVYAGIGGDIKTIQDLYSVNLGREADAAGAAYWAAQFLGDGVISAEERQKFAIASMDEYRSRVGLAVGTNYVPYDGFKATLHEGEAVVPKAYNPAAGGSANGKLEALVEGLTAEVQRLQQIVNDGNQHQRRTADVLDGANDGGAIRMATA